MIKTKISDKYNQLVPSFGGTSYSQVTEYLLKEKDTFSDEGKELICMNFPGHKKENFKARLRDDDMKSLIGAYYNWAANLVEIDLSHNKIGNDGSNLISKLLDKAESLRKLNLKSNEISDNGSDKIALSLLNKPELVEVNLNSNLITDKGMLQLIEVIYNTPS